MKNEPLIIKKRGEDGSRVITVRIKEIENRQKVNDSDGFLLKSCLKFLKVDT